MKLQNKLDEAIYKAVSLCNDKVELVIVHPHTLGELIAELNSTSDKEGYFDHSTFSYRGIKVYRSFDVPLDEFKVR